MPRRLPRFVALAAVFLTLFIWLRSSSKQHDALQSQPDRLSKSSSSSSSPPSYPPPSVDESLPPPSYQKPLPAGSRFKPASFDWTTVKKYHPISSFKPLPSDPAPRPLSRVQAPASAFAQSAKTKSRQDAVRDAFKRNYDAYKKYAWMRDELTPISKSSKDTFCSWAATLVDSLDTMWIMGLEQEFKEAVKDVVAIDWSVTNCEAANLFETTIRHLGGLLGAYELSGDEDLLRKAEELGEMLYVAFDTPNNMPGFWLNWQDARTGYQTAGYRDASAGPSSLCLEFTRLSQLTGNPKFYDATDRITRFLERTQNTTMLPGMWPLYLDFKEERASLSAFTIGGGADSLYEYLPKMMALLGGRDPSYETMYRVSMDVITEHLLFRPMLPGQEDVLFAGDSHVKSTGPEPSAQGQHLSCFAGGMYALGGKLFGIDEHVRIGDRLARGCGWAYSKFPTGIMPEIFSMLTCPTLEPCEWDERRWKKEGNQRLPKGFKGMSDTRYILRPEAIESIFIMYRITAKEDLQDMAWDMFEAIMKATTTKIANSAIKDVSVTPVEVQFLDSMESFWMAETLKYFYLIFSPPDLISLDEYVLNTEAHPFKRQH